MTCLQLSLQIHMLMFFALEQKLQSHHMPVIPSVYHAISSLLAFAHVLSFAWMKWLFYSCSFDWFSLISNSWAQISPPLGNISQTTHKGGICSDVPITPWACFHSITCCVYWLSREPVYSALSSVTGTTSCWILFLFLDFLPWPYISLGLFYNDLGWYFLT